MHSRSSRIECTTIKTTSPSRFYVTRAHIEKRLIAGTRAFPDIVIRKPNVDGDLLLTYRITRRPQTWSVDHGTRRKHFPRGSNCLSEKSIEPLHTLERINNICIITFIVDPFQSFIRLSPPYFTYKNIPWPSNITNLLIINQFIHFFVSVNTPTPPRPTKLPKTAPYLRVCGISSKTPLYRLLACTICCKNNCRQFQLFSTIETLCWVDRITVENIRTWRLSLK